MRSKGHGFPPATPPQAQAASSDLCHHHEFCCQETGRAGCSSIDGPTSTGLNWTRIKKGTGLLLVSSTIANASAI
jgi:hypothetical protein